MLSTPCCLSLQKKSTDAYRLTLKHTYTHTHTRTHACTHTHTHTHTQPNTTTHTQTHTHAHTHSQSHAHTYTHKYTNTHTHTHTHIYTHTHNYTNTHTHTHTYTHTYTHTTHIRIGITSGILAVRGINAAATQSLLNYALLSCVCGAVHASHHGWRWPASQNAWHVYALLALMDVEANFIVTKVGCGAQVWCVDLV